MNRRGRIRDRGATLKIERGGGGLTSDSKLGGGLNFQYLFIVSKKVGGGGGGAGTEGLLALPPPWALRIGER